MKHIIGVILVLVVSTFFVNSCKKTEKMEGLNKEQLSSIFENKLKGKRTTLSRYVPKEGTSSRLFSRKSGDGSVESKGGLPPCPTGTFVFNLINSSNEFVYLSCSTSPNFTYSTRVKWSVQNNTNATFVNPTSPFVAVYSNSGNFPLKNVSSSTTLLYTNGTIYYYETIIDYSTIGVNFCGESDLNFYVNIYSTCTGVPAYPIWEAEYSINFIDYCNSVPYIQILPNSATSEVYVRGWSLICVAPCNTSAALKYDFEIRLVGSSTWTSYDDFYFSGMTLTLSSGDYEYRYRNQASSTSCAGPWSDILYFTL